MLIIYSGWGLIVLPFAVLAFLLRDYVRRTWGLDDALSDVFGLGAFALFCIVAGRYLNNRPGVVSKSRLFFINVEIIGYLAVFWTALTFVAYEHPTMRQSASAQTQQEGSAAAAEAIEARPAALAAGSAQPQPAEPSPALTRPQRPVTLLTVDWAPRTEHDAMTGSDTNEIAGEVTFSDGTYVEVEAFIHEPVLVVWFTTFVGRQPKNFNSTEKTMKLRVRIGDRDVVTSEATRDYQNRAQIYFWDHQSLDAAGLGMSKPSTNGPAFLTNWLALTSRFQVTSKGAGQIRDLLSSSRGLVELPLVDGSSNVVDLNPRHPVFRDFVTGFLKEVALTNPAPAAPASTAAQPRPAAKGFPDWCAKKNPRSSAAKIICSDRQLGAADLKFAELYTGALNIEDNETRARALRSIRAFRKDQSGCEDVGDAAVRRCLSVAYGTVISALSKELGRP